VYSAFVDDVIFFTQWAYGASCTPPGEDRAIATGNMRRKFDRRFDNWFFSYAGEQTYTHPDTLMAILCTLPGLPRGGGGKIYKRLALLIACRLHADNTDWMSVSGCVWNAVTEN